MNTPNDTVFYFENNLNIHISNLNIQISILNIQNKKRKLVTAPRFRSYDVNINNVILSTLIKLIHIS